MRRFEDYDFESRDVLQVEETLYYKNLFYRCAKMLVETENLVYNEEADNFYHPSTGEYIDEGF